MTESFLIKLSQWDDPISHVDEFKCFVKDLILYYISLVPDNVSVYVVPDSGQKVITL